MYVCVCIGTHMCVNETNKIYILVHNKYNSGVSYVILSTFFLFVVKYCNDT